MGCVGRLVVKDNLAVQQPQGAANVSAFPMKTLHNGKLLSFTALLQEKLKFFRQKILFMWNKYTNFAL
ncbi:hypothetical protein D770_14815 [Flammeovirgaceae bacterium 311]|nr:hypothetical protein D770_14815 [Flammeovirgaceae bacterium 311]